MTPQTLDERKAEMAKKKSKKQKCKDTKPAYEEIRALRFFIGGISVLIEEIRINGDYLFIRLDRNEHDLFAELIKFGGHEKGFQYYGSPIASATDQFAVSSNGIEPDDEIDGEELSNMILEYLNTHPLPVKELIR